MFTLSISGLMLVLAKLLVVGLSLLFSALLILWPISEQKVSKTQKVIYCIVNIVVAAYIFGVI